jgi:hypothetical protein
LDIEQGRALKIQYWRGLGPVLRSHSRCTDALASRELESKSTDKITEPALLALLTARTPLGVAIAGLNAGVLLRRSRALSPFQQSDATYGSLRTRK